nr:uncharacterized protein LOC123774836 [Procambarus clarkii]
MYAAYQRARNRAINTAAPRRASQRFSASCSGPLSVKGMKTKEVLFRFKMTEEQNKARSSIFPDQRHLNLLTFEDVPLITFKSSKSLIFSSCHPTVAPVCQEDQRQEYVAPSGGSVTLACTVVAYPASVTFSWAIKRTPETPPVRLHSMGRKEGLTGHYTLTRVEEESFEVWCWAQNTVGAQTAPCKFTVYTQGRPGPVHSCRVTNHTAHGFLVHCVSGPLRSVNTQYTLLVYAQKQESSRGGSEESSSSNTSSSISSSSSSRGTQQKKEGGGGAVHTLGQLVQNTTTTSPFFVVGGLQSGQEFALVVQVSNEEGVSPPVVLSAFTLKDNAQTVIGLPTGGGGCTRNTGNSMPTGNGARPISGGGGAGGGGVSPGGGVSGPGAGVGSVDAEEDEGPGGNTRMLELVPPIIIVLVASLTTILVMALLVILLLKRRSRLRRLEQEIKQVKLNKKVRVHSRGEDSPSSRDTPGYTNSP